MPTKRLSFGADPEFFLTEGEKPISAHGIVPGTKNSPHRVIRGAVQVDGMALEINIDPVFTEDTFVLNINEVLTQLKMMIPKKYKISSLSSVHFPKEVMDKQPLFAKQLGCEVDFNAWTEEENPMPKLHESLRTAAGHLHIGFVPYYVNEYELSHFFECCAIVKQLDVGLSVPAILVEEDTERKKLYGKAGAFRPKRYGVEYRTLSNIWLKKEEWMRHLIKVASTAIDDLDRGREYFLEAKTLGIDIENTINTGDREAATFLIKELKLMEWQNEG